MSNHVSSSKISNWSKPRLALIISAVALMGQSCSFSIGGSGQAASGGVFRSDDRGQTWQAKNFVRQEKKKAISINDVTVLSFVFHPRTPEAIYLGTRENGLWRTADAGEHWQATSLRTGGYQCIDFDPNNPSIMYTASGALGLKSLDGGTTWKTMYTESQPGQGVTCVAVDRARGNIIWLVTSGGKIIRSDDYGQTWTLKQTVASFSPRLMMVDPAGGGSLLVFTRSRGIFSIAADGLSSTDMSAGLVPFKKSLSMNAVAIGPGASPQWWIATTTGLLTSTDHGTTWTLIKTLVTTGSIAINTVAVNPKNKQDIFITTNRHLHHTLDGGLTWTVSILPTTRLPVLLTFTPDDSDRLFFSTFKVEEKK